MQVADFKDEISPAVVAELADQLRRAWPEFPREAFVDDACRGLAGLELMARIKHVAAAMRRAMPEDFPRAAEVLREALRSPSLDGWLTLPCGFYVADHGIDDPDVALPLLAALTPRFSSEGPVRPFLERHPEVTSEHLRRWAKDPDPHVRRLVSEGTRPRLPWAPVLRRAVADPTPSLELLDVLYDDESDYVRRSVANHLNDISRDHPALAVDVAGRWLASGSPRAAWTVRHGLRTLVKRGDPRALELLGFGSAEGVVVRDLEVTPRELPVGGEVTLAFSVVSERGTRAAIDYVVHHVGARGPRQPKVFKLTTRALVAGEPVRVTRRHAFREVSVRRLYPGVHRIEVQVNGQVLAGTEVTLCPPARR